MENTKSFTQLDYNKSHRETVESWFDREAVKYTGCDDGWDSYFEYMKQEPETVLNENCPPGWRRMVLCIPKKRKVEQNDK